ncbi:MAG TPA: PAS and ANTAR domain-containing protein [Frankiaceae bacterium]|nr:PAS and ANTAR domain-containing protein [Frankiaceae bacterium]
MQTSRRPAEDARPTPDAADLARFEWELTRDRWWWSDGMYAAHGFTARGVEPSLEHLLNHQHPKDRDRTKEAFARVRRDGRPFVFEHRILTEATGVRTMILSVSAHLGPDRQPRLVSGALLDVSEARRLHHAAEQDSIAGLQAELMRLSAAADSRELIGQATGVLMERHKVTANEAAALLRRASQTAGRKLPDVASELLYTGKLVG